MYLFQDIALTLIEAGCDTSCQVKYKYYLTLLFTCICIWKCTFYVSITNPYAQT